MTPEDIEHHNKTAEWLLKSKPHRVLAYLKSLSADELSRAYQCRTQEDADAFNDHMHDEVARYGSN
jgi:hypothetical protein